MGDPRDSLVISTRRDGDKAVVELDGELDLYASPKLTTAIEELLAAGVTAIEIDAAALTFADSAGLRAFLLARKEADAGGAQLRVTQVSEPLDRVLEMTGLREVLGASTP
ncbi:MAG TPA: STAS domain-containing protein [Acidimicrobiales bacterium]|nr:STAS domain-containing protein [Acidimicrobiales bacterium]